MKFRQPTPRRSRSHLTGSLDGPSRTITVEPVETPAPAPPPEVQPRAQARAAVEALAAGCALALIAHGRCRPPLPT